MTINVNTLNPGDTLTATFSDGTAGDFTVTGALINYDSHGDLYLAGWPVREGTQPGEALVKIENILPAEPPVGTILEDVESSNYFMHLPQGWLCVSSMFDSAISWKAVVEAGGDLVEVTA